MNEKQVLFVFQLIQINAAIGGVVHTVPELLQSQPRVPREATVDDGCDVEGGEGDTGSNEGVFELPQTRHSVLLCFAP